MVGPLKKELFLRLSLYNFLFPFYFVYIIGIDLSRVADLSGVDPDSDSTLKEEKYGYYSDRHEKIGYRIDMYVLHKYRQTNQTCRRVE